MGGVAAGSALQYVERVLRDAEVRGWLRMGEGGSDDAGDECANGATRNALLRGVALSPAAVADAQVCSLFDRALPEDPQLFPLLNQTDAASSSVSAMSGAGSDSPSALRSNQALGLMPAIESIVYRVRSRGALHFVLSLVDSKRHALFNASAGDNLGGRERVVFGVVDTSCLEVMFVVLAYRKPDLSLVIDVSITSPHLRTLGESFVFAPGTQLEEPFLFSRLRKKLALVSTTTRELGCEFCRHRYYGNGALCTCSVRMLDRRYFEKTEFARECALLTDAARLSERAAATVLFGSAQASFTTFVSFVKAVRSDLTRRRVNIFSADADDVNVLVPMSHSAMLSRHSMRTAADADKVRGLLVNKFFATWAVDRFCELENSFECASKILDGVLSDDDGDGAQNRCLRRSGLLSLKSLYESGDSGCGKYETRCHAGGIVLLDPNGDRCASKSAPPQSAYGPDCTSNEISSDAQRFRRRVSRDMHTDGSVHEGAQMVKRRRQATSTAHGCIQCGATFRQLSHLQAHVAQVHVGEYQHECAQCGRRFKVLGNLNQHVRLVHSEARAFRCALCPSTFKLNAKLRRHIATVHSASAK